MGAHYWFNATAPRTCRTATLNCTGGNDTRDVEVYSEPCLLAGVPPIAVVRFLWDIYDNIDDAGYVDTLSLSFAGRIDTLGNYPNTTTNGGRNEAWNSALSAIDDQNGRSASDYLANHTTSVSAQRNANCSP